MTTTLIAERDAGELFATVGIPKLKASATTKAVTFMK
jgi:hypothetical protein